jgi:hypothetical protein
MRVFVDTEFTDFLDCELISIALVAEDGREFYGELSDFDTSICSAFVREAVLPQLGQRLECVFRRDDLRKALHVWLETFTQEVERWLCFDYGGDWELMCDLLEGPPAGWQACHVGEFIDPVRLEAYYRLHHGRHHALIDARAHRYAFVTPI